MRPRSAAAVAVSPPLLVEKARRKRPKAPTPPLNNPRAQAGGQTAHSAKAHSAIVMTTKITIELPLAPAVVALPLKPSPAHNRARPTSANSAFRSP